MYDFCKKRMSKPHQFHNGYIYIYTTEGALAERNNTKLCIEGGQDATLRGAKDDLNLKENKTNTSRKRLKTLTEDSNQQPVKRKKK
jgi:hypothetical protein